jgi:hypothetical protein
MVGLGNGVFGESQFYFFYVGWRAADRRVCAGKEGLMRVFHRAHATRALAGTRWRVWWRSVGSAGV